MITFDQEDEICSCVCHQALPPSVINPTRPVSQAMRWNPQAPCLQNPNSSQGRGNHRDELRFPIVAVTVFDFIVSHVIISCDSNRGLEAS